MGHQNQKPKLIYLVTEAGYFVSHRLPTARAAQDAGFDVSVITNPGTQTEVIEKSGIHILPLDLSRGSLNPFKAIGSIIDLAHIYRREKPTAVHHIAMKPVLYGSVATWLAKIPHVVNAFAGLGYVFTSGDLKARILRFFLLVLFRPLLKRKGSVLLLQNKDDYALLERHNLTNAHSLVIRGSGVDLNAYPSHPLPDIAPDFICVYSGRMLGIKGLDTLKSAFEVLKKTHPHIKLWLCGGPDPANPSSWTEEELQAWANKNENVDYKGHTKDMSHIWSQAHLAVQASHGGEGVPKSLLEAASCARAIMATDVPGCRDVVQEGVNGTLFPPGDPESLASAIAKIAENTDHAARMGEESRKFIEGSDMTATAVEEQLGEMYKRMTRS